MNKFDVPEKPVTVDVELVVVNKVFEFVMVTSLITFNSTGEAALLFPISLKSELRLEPIELFEVMVSGSWVVVGKNKFCDGIEFVLPFKDDVIAVLDFVVTIMSDIAVFSAKLMFNVIFNTGAVVVVIVSTGVTVVTVDGGLVERRDGAGNVGPTLFDVGVVGELKE